MEILALGELVQCCEEERQLFKITSKERKYFLKSAHLPVSLCVTVSAETFYKFVAHTLFCGVFCVDCQIARF